MSGLPSRPIEAVKGGEKASNVCACWRGSPDLRGRDNLKRLYILSSCSFVRLRSTGEFVASLNGHSEVSAILMQIRD